jgi:hypothetical protein
VFLGIYFSCDVPGDTVPDTLASDNSRLAKLLLVLIKIVGKILALLGYKFSTERLYVGWLDSHVWFL